jgi:hypothetical protein
MGALQKEVWCGAVAGWLAAAVALYSWYRLGRAVPYPALLVLMMMVLMALIALTVALPIAAAVQAAADDEAPVIQGLCDAAAAVGGVLLVFCIGHVAVAHPKAPRTGRLGPQHILEPWVAAGGAVVGALLTAAGAVMESR